MNNLCLEFTNDNNIDDDDADTDNDTNDGFV